MSDAGERQLKGRKVIEAKKKEGLGPNTKKAPTNREIGEKSIVQITNPHRL